MSDEFAKQLSVLCCPRCGADLGCRTLPPEGGEMPCPACGEAYPYRRGVLGLVYVDATWFWPLHEFLATQELARKALSGELEPDRIEIHNPHAFATMTGIEEMTDAVMAGLGEPRGRVVLEPGCGSCGNAKRLADAGFSVIALDVKPSELLYPRPRDVIKPSECFFASYFDQKDVFAPEEIRFLRVLGDVFNLPIADGSIDLVFTRAMLHHIDPLPPAMVEAGRVLKEGGRWAAAAEPASGALQWDTRPLVDWAIESQEGLHERCPRFSEYLKGFRRGGMRVEACEAWHAQPRVEIGLKRYRRLRLSWAGPELGDGGHRKFPLWQLRFMKTGSNFFARRTESPPRPRRRDPGRQRFVDPVWLLEPERSGSQLRNALRRLVPAERLANPARLGRLPNPEIQLRGFRQAERAEGRLVRYATRSASVFLPRPGARPERVGIEYFVPSCQTGPPIEARVLLNDRTIRTIRREKPGPHRVEFPVPPEIADDPGVLEVELKLDRWWHDSQGRSLGLAIERVFVE